MNTSYIGLGSNLEQPTEQLTSALYSLAKLPASELHTCSPFYRSRALGPGVQPDYINAVAQLHTLLEPKQLLNLLQGIEQQHGRLRLERWGPRTLDLDLLLFDQLTLDTPDLQLPHPRMLQRDFVLVPLHDICPRLRLPNGAIVAELIATMDTSAMALHCPPPTIAKLQSPKPMGV
jgi:2-amino-4-hydroxy-6-hydroxymethyldihydropteridine diphosphokinase